MRLLKFILGKALSALVAVAAVVLVIGLWQLKLPIGLVIGAGVVMAGLVVLSFWLTRLGFSKLRMTIGVIVAFLLLVSFVTGSKYVWQAVKTIDVTTDNPTETVVMGLYMRTNDPRTFDDASAVTYQYGILQTIDREPTDLALEQLTEKLKAQVTCREYQTPAELIDALINGEVDVIILNEGFLQTLEEMPGFGVKLAAIREVELRPVEVPVEPVPEPEATTNPTQSDSTEATIPTTVVKSKPFVVCLSGIDSRTGGPTARSCSDVNILAVVNPETRQILLVSTPRDFYVPLSISGGIPDKLTHAGLYGVNVTKDTLGMLYGVNVDYYFKVNFSGFKDVVDALGGITVYSEYAFTGTASKVSYTFEKGANELNGERALAFCRIRDAFLLADRQRGKNQMAVIKAVIEKAMSPALLTNYTETLNAVEKSVNMNIPKELIGNLVGQQLLEGGSWNISTYSVNGYDDYAVPYSINIKTYVMRPNQSTVDKAKQMIADVLEGKTVEP